MRVAAEDLARADRLLVEHVRRIRLDNAEAILEAKNERTASLYLDGLLDTDEHRRLEADRARAELDHQHARREVERQDPGDQWWRAERYELTVGTDASPKPPIV